MITYEWVIETVDEFGDIVDVDHSKTLPDAMVTADHLRSEGKRVEVGLVRDEWDDFDGDLEDRQWAYLTDGKLPLEFDGGASVPKKFRT